MSGRELKPSDIVNISQTLAHWAMAGNVNPTMIWLKMGLSPGIFRANQNANDLWFETTQAVHAGRSGTAGYRSDAVARLVDALAWELQGNDELNRLAYSLGSAAPPQATAGLSIFLSYATANRADVDALYLALIGNAPHVPVFQDHRSIAAGKDWLDEIRDAAGNTSLLVGWLTQDYLASAFCSYEIGLAESRGSKIIPILIDPAAAPKAPAYLSRPQMLRLGVPLNFDVIAKDILALLP